MQNDWLSNDRRRPGLADIVAKVFLHDQSRNLLAVGATFE
jgi:hypothetical protein